MSPAPRLPVYLATQQREPTDRQLEVLGVIRARILRDGWSPTIRELCAELGIASTNGLCDHLEALERKGLLVRAPILRSRPMRVTDAGLKALAGRTP